MNREEERVHNAVTRFLRLQYKDCMFRTDGAGLPMARITKDKFLKQQSDRKGYPDLTLLHQTGDFAGCMIEIKTDDSKVLKKNGEFKKNEHIETQFNMLRRLNERGYYAVFGCGIDECMKIVRAYLEGDHTELDRIQSKYHLHTPYLEIA